MILHFLFLLTWWIMLSAVIDRYKNTSNRLNPYKWLLSEEFFSNFQIQKAKAKRSWSFPTFLNFELSQFTLFQKSVSFTLLPNSHFRFIVRVTGCTDVTRCITVHTLSCSVLATRQPGQPGKFQNPEISRSHDSRYRNQESQNHFPAKAKREEVLFSCKSE